MAPAMELAPHPYPLPRGEAVTIMHGLADALAAVQAGGTDLITSPGASAYIGAAMFAAMVSDIRAQAPDAGRIIYDCGSRPGDVLAGLRAGLAHFCMDDGAVTPALLDLAGKHAATIVERSCVCLS